CACSHILSWIRIYARLFGMIQLSVFFSFEVRLDALVAIGIRDKKRLLIPRRAYGQAVPTGIAVPPSFEQLPRLIINKDIVFSLIGQHDEAPLRVLYHFVTVVYRVFASVQYSPSFNDFVFMGAMSDDLVLFPTVRLLYDDVWQGYAS